MMFLAYVATVLAALSESVVDVDKIKDKQPINYLLSIVGRIVGGVTLMVLYHEIGVVLNLFHGLLFMAALGSIYWIVFDIGINVGLDRSIFELGKTSRIDRLMRRVGEYYAMFIKFAIMFVANFSYFLYFDYYL